MREKPVALDIVATDYSQRIAEVIGKEVKDGKKVGGEDVDNFLTKALGILQENGVYAMALFILSRSRRAVAEGEDFTNFELEELIATWTIAKLWGLLGEDALEPLGVRPDSSQEITLENLNNTEQKDRILKHFSNRVCRAELGTLLSIKDVFERTLIYARYHAKALKE